MNAPCRMVVALLALVPAGPLAGQAPRPRLDSIAAAVLAREHVVGAAVLVRRGADVLLQRGYGFADLGLEAPVGSETVFHVVGPMLPFTGVAVLQLVEQRKLSLDDDVARYIPEFPMQGHRVTIRQLLNHTSGIVDYHYLGDPIDATSRQPKALDEVMALYAGKQWVNEPGTRWDWSISGFQLLVTIVERLSGQSFGEYARQHIFEPAGLRSTTYCDDFSLVHNLSHAYRRFESGFVPANENDMAYNADLRFCSTVGDLDRLWAALRAGRLIRAETFQQMQTAEGAAIHMSAQDSLAHYGLALTINHEDAHVRIGQHGSLFGYSGSLYAFPGDDLTIVVLSNTEGQNAYAVTRALARAVLGLSPLPVVAPGAESHLADAAVTPEERSSLNGTYVLKLDRLNPGLHDSYAQYRRTYRVFDENGRLMIQTLGEGPERLLKQDDGSFGVRSAPRSRFTFEKAQGKAVKLLMDSQGLGVPLSGARVGDGDPVTFHLQRP